MLAGFSEPLWDAPVDVEAEARALPASATIKGLFLLPMVAEATRRRLVLRAARDRYLPFVDYPLIEHLRLLIEAAHAFYPELSTRRGLRRLGRAAPRAIGETLVGKVHWSTVTDITSGLEYGARMYAITAPSSRVVILENAPGQARLRLEGSHCFVDSNHVGTWEGILRACDVEGTVAVRIESSRTAELALEWPSASPKTGSAPPRPLPPPRSDR
jgi:uncharacterized protein (TIGR02265 family)